MTQAEAREYTHQTCAKFNQPPPPDTGNSWCAYLTDGGDAACLCYKCPSCGYSHSIPIHGPKAWGWNGRLDLPELSPSIKCTYGPGEDPHIANRVCHHFLRAGAVEMCGDSTAFIDGGPYRPGPLPLEFFPVSKALS